MLELIHTSYLAYSGLLLQVKLQDVAYIYWVATSAVLLLLQLLNQWILLVSFS